MKTILVAAGMLAAATFAGGNEANAADKSFGLTIGGPNGYIEIGANGRDFDYRYGRYNGHDHVYHGPKRRHFHGHCLNRKQIRRRLKRQGWHGFHDFKRRRHAYVVYAWRPNGHEYKLRIDRCDGTILKARHMGRDYGRYRHGGVY